MARTQPWQSTAESEYDIRRRQARIPAAYEDFTLDGWPKASLYPEVVGTLKEVIGMYKGTPRWPSWYIWGDYGGGKTGLACGFANQLMRDGQNRYGGTPAVLFTTVPDLLGEIRSSYDRREGQPTEWDLLERYGTHPLVILDDLGAEQVKGSGWVEERLYQIINRRLTGLHTTIFTSNKSLVEIAERLGDRIVWRIIEMVGDGQTVEIKGANLRDRNKVEVPARPHQTDTQRS